ncbi:hypothetical protein CRG94_23930 [Escherichia sp. E3356]|nr:hypothetical protein CRG94_23930 [Escherichia sp. E3356]
MISPMNSISHNYTANNMFLNAGIISWSLALFFWYSGKFFIAVILFFLIIFSFLNAFFTEKDTHDV